MHISRRKFTQISIAASVGAFAPSHRASAHPLQAFATFIAGNSPRIFNVRRPIRSLKNLRLPPGARYVFKSTKRLVEINDAAEFFYDIYQNVLMAPEILDSITNYRSRNRFFLFDNNQPKLKVWFKDELNPFQLIGENPTTQDIEEYYRVTCYDVNSESPIADLDQIGIKSKRGTKFNISLYQDGLPEHLNIGDIFRIRHESEGQGFLNISESGPILVATKDSFMFSESLTIADDKSSSSLYARHE
ncbi:MAG: hypothetical protein ACFB2Z_09000 [Maricaulaceae bacterium]